MNRIDNYLRAIRELLSTQQLNGTDIKNTRQTIVELLKEYPDQRDYIVSQFKAICGSLGIDYTIFFPFLLDSKNNEDRVL